MSEAFLHQLKVLKCKSRSPFLLSLPWLCPLLQYYSLFYFWIGPSLGLSVVFRQEGTFSHAPLVVCALWGVGFVITTLRYSKITAPMIKSAVLCCGAEGVQERFFCSTFHFIILYTKVLYWVSGVVCLRSLSSSAWLLYNNKKNFIFVWY